MVWEGNKNADISAMVVNGLEGRISLVQGGKIDEN